MVTLLLLARSNCGINSASGCVRAPADRSLISAARATRGIAKSSTAALSARASSTDPCRTRRSVVDVVTGPVASRQLDLAAERSRRQSARQAGGAGAPGQHNRRRRLATQVLQFANCALDAHLRRFAVTRHCLGKVLRIDLEADRQRPHIREDLRFADVERRTC